MWRDIAGLLALLTTVTGNIIVFTKESPHVIAEEFLDMPASFGPTIPLEGLRGLVVPGSPPDGCGNLTAPPDYANFNGKWIVLVARYGCNFETKVRNAQAAGYHCAIVHNVNSSEIETMSAKDPEGITIPSVFVSDSAGFMLMDLYNYTSGYYVMVNDDIPFNINTHLLLPFAVVVVLCLIIIIISMIVKCVRERRRARRQRLPNKFLNKIPTCKFSKVVPYDTCAICLDDYQEGETLRVLPCAHAYHAACVDPWLTQSRRVCPVCKRRVYVGKERARDSDSDDDTAPLVPADDDSLTTNSGTFAEQRENPFVRATRLMRRLRRELRQETQTPSAEAEPEPEEATEENQEDNTNPDTQPLLPTAAAVSERPPRNRRRRSRSARNATATRSIPTGTQVVPALPRSDGVSINTDNGEGEIGVAALPAPPLASSTPHHLNL